VSIYKEILDSKKKKKKKFVVLIDPDKIDNKNLDIIFKLSFETDIDYFFIGGSLLRKDILDELIIKIKTNTSIPVILFPGSPFQISNKADAILLLSLISGRNPELLIGNHVISAPLLKQYGLEIISTGYMLIDGGRVSSTSYISNTIPIPNDREDIAVSTSIAAEMIGYKLIYMDAGSGAKISVSESMTKEVSSNISLPLIVGGGIDNIEKAKNLCRAGADIIVVGNAIEKNKSLIKKLSDAIHSI